jgi:hypothetical protein
MLFAGRLYPLLSKTYQQNFTCNSCSSRGHATDRCCRDAPLVNGALAGKVTSLISLLIILGTTLQSIEPRTQRIAPRLALMEHILVARAVAFSLRWDSYTAALSSLDRRFESSELCFCSFRHVAQTTAKKSYVNKQLLFSCEHSCWRGGLPP